MKPGRNDLCGCGSGLKYKQCCEGRVAPTQWWKYSAAGAGALIIVAGFAMALMDWANREPVAPGPAPPGKVWSEEHGHWHDLAPGAGESASQPGGSPPPGKVWSTEHGHWHDANPQPGGAAGTPPPLDGTQTSPAPVSEAPVDSNE